MNWQLVEWLREYKDPLTLLVSVGTLVVWILYAQLLLNNYQRQRRPRIIINRGAGKGIGSLCLISNMSAEPIFINQIVLRLNTSQGPLCCDVTDIREESKGEIEQDLILHKATRQGPLRTGDFTHIGTFATLIQRLALLHDIPMQGHLPDAAWRFLDLEIRVIAFYGSDKHAIGARRTFNLGEAAEGGCQLFAQSRESQQYNSRWQRRQVRRHWMLDVEG
ncbi:hypothetical protein M1B34_04735 [Pseudomonas sp. MAFF 302030]|jgi:hypothetical protein|uniref:Uncharacterized protein n=1 Tax=Pseudomonas morbosilactucae TaxID=2938197 RepID=A0A9X1YVD3_9PSED|nr:hypothetical protein [Pseudomonas morbosilactucae]MCK9797065.1 hypothetical protein [Pseudomonas morbosilactucae]MCK9813025.1 hypothetical protein [Pseudomonas morbosilactucae]WEK09999.1 MAG: hypothetical protein P0Y51_03345 [Pseudomonas sp.]